MTFSPTDRTPAEAITERAPLLTSIEVAYATRLARGTTAELAALMQEAPRR